MSTHSVAPVHVDFSESDIAQILDTLRSKLAAGQVSQGSEVAAFEREFAYFVGSAHAVALSSGSAAIEAAVAALKPDGATVLVPANTNFATYVSVLRGGARVRLVDVDPATLSPSVDDLENGFDATVAGVVVVHMGGIISRDLSAIANWCTDRGIWLLEDCAHAHGSFLGGRHAGRFGVGGAFSFFATKVMTSGEGGMFVTDDESLAQEVRLFRNLGKPNLWENHHVRLGTNARMSEFCAIVGRRQLFRLKEFVDARQRVAGQYTNLLDGFEHGQVVLPADRYSGYKYVVLLASDMDRDRVAQEMRARGVPPSGYIYETPLHRQPVLAQSFEHAAFPASERYCAQHICLPIHSKIDCNSADLVAKVFLQSCAAARRR
jgi:dTDP-4-amino-4,6-dideoxygalactose transaminase